MSFRAVVGIRHEHKSPWERRAPLAPTHVRQLVERHGLHFEVERSTRRAFDDHAYLAAGAQLVDDLGRCDAILGVKEIPPQKLLAGKTYLYFAHVIKGQPFNMPMLKTLLDRGCNLIDYERITDDGGQRLIFFGRYAGLAGMIETLWAAGQRWARRGLLTPFAAVRRPFEYAGIDEAKRHFRQIGARIAREGIAPELRPLTIGLTGYGNVSRGARELLELLPCRAVEPEALTAGALDEIDTARHVVEVVFEERHMFEPTDADQSFELQHYYDHPKLYRSSFERSWPRLRLLLNCIYWDTPYPRLVTVEALRRRAAEGPVRLEVIGDLSCDIRGAIEVTRRPTTVDEPVFTYDPAGDRIRTGLDGPGPVIMAIDNLPCELATDSTQAFGDGLSAFVPALVEAHGPHGLDARHLPPELARALIVHRGELTADYRYLGSALR